MYIFLNEKAIKIFYNYFKKISKNTKKYIGG